MPTNLPLSIIGNRLTCSVCIKRTGPLARRSIFAANTMLVHQLRGFATDSPELRLLPTGLITPAAFIDDPSWAILDQ